MVQQLKVEYYNPDTQIARVSASFQRGINVVRELLFIRTAVPVTEGQMLQFTENPEISVSELIDEKTGQKRTFKWIVSGVELIEGEE